MIDSVALIRESHRHAVRTVLGEDWEDERLVANVGRPLLEQMAAFSPERSEELYRVYREWNHANTAALLLAYADIEAALRELRDAGRRLGVVTSKSRDAVDLAWERPAEPARAVRRRDGRRGLERHKPAPDPVLGPSSASAPARRAPATWATRPSTSSPAGRPGWSRSASRGASSRARRSRPSAPTAIVETPGRACAGLPRGRAA